MKKIVFCAVTASFILYTSCTSTPKSEETAIENNVQAEEPISVANKDESIEEPETQLAQPLDVFDSLSIIEEPEIFDLPPEENTEPIKEPTQEIADEETIESEPIQVEVIEDFSQPKTATEIEQVETEEPSAIAEITTEETLPAEPESSITKEPTPIIAIDPVDPEVTIPEDSLAEENLQETMPTEEEPVVIVPSRSVILQRNQYIDITYPGNGWIFMGETEKEKKLVFFGRKIATDNTEFTLRSRFAGTTMLHFYKNDVLTGSYIDDYLEVIIEDVAAAPSSPHIQAPSYAQVVPPKPDRTRLTQMKEENTLSDEKEQNSETTNETPKIPANTASTAVTSTTGTNTTPSASSNTQITQSVSADDEVKTVIQTTGAQEESSSSPVAPSIPLTSAVANNSTQTQAQKSATTSSKINTDSMSATDILKQAQQAYDKAQYEQAFSLLTDFFEKSDTDIDKGLYLQGQVLEAKSSIQDIKSAIDAYDTIVRNYQQSPLWRKANDRSSYLKRFYINIR